MPPKRRRRPPKIGTLDKATVRIMRKFYEAIGGPPQRWELTFERRHRVLRAKAAGVIATQDLLDLDIALIAFLAREETADRPSIRGLYDFSEIAAIAVPQTKAAERGSRPSIVRGQRVLVQSRTTACSLLEAFVQSQRMTGDNHLTVVDSLDEAHALLGLNGPLFEVIE